MNESSSVEPSGGAIRQRGLGAAVAAVVALSPVSMAAYPPSADLYQWIYQGAILGRILSWGGGDALPAAAFGLTPVPPPNLAAPLGIALLGSVLGPLNAGRAFLALCVLVLGLGYAYLLRGVHGRATALEPLGFAWGYGYMAYGGYLSNQFAVGLAFITIGRLVRCSKDDGDSPSRRDLAVITVMSLLTYLAHLLGWAVVVVAVAIRAIGLTRSGRRRDGLFLIGSQLPAIVLFAGYALSRIGASKTYFYSSPAGKIATFLDPLTFFFRTDPLTPSFSLLWVNLACAAAVLAVVAASFGRGNGVGFHRTVLVSGLALLAIAALLPVRSLGGAGHPDERLVLPGLLLVVAALPLRPWTRTRGLAVTAVVCAVLALHSFEYRRAGGELSLLRENLERVLPERGSVLSVRVWNPAEDSDCRRAKALSRGVDALKWFGILRAIEEPEQVACLVNTSILRYSPRYEGRVPAWFERIDPADRRDIRMVRAESKMWFDTVVLLGCPDELSEVRKVLGPGLKSTAVGPYFVVLHNTMPRARPRTGHPPEQR